MFIIIFNERFPYKNKNYVSVNLKKITITSVLFIMREWHVVQINIGFPLINYNGQGKPFASTTKKTSDFPNKHGRDGGDPGRTVGPADTLEEDRKHCWTVNGLGASNTGCIIRHTHHQITKRT